MVSLREYPAPPASLRPGAARPTERAEQISAVLKRGQGNFNHGWNMDHTRMGDRMGILTKDREGNEAEAVGFDLGLKQKDSDKR